MADLPTLLRDAAPVGAPVDLDAIARRVRQRHRRRVGLLVGTPVLAAAALAAVVGLLVVPGSAARQTVRVGTTPPATDRPASTIDLPAGRQVAALAAAGQTLYVTTSAGGDRPYALSAYAAATGRLLRRVALPAMPATLHVGPGGRVWVSFYADQDSGPSGIWMFNTALTRHSAAPGEAVTALLPVGPDRALIADQHGLDRLTLPSPGRPGRARWRRIPHSSLGVPLHTAPGYFLAQFDGRVVAQVTNGNGGHSHLVVAGRPTSRFGGGPRDVVASVAEAGGHLWAAVHPAGTWAGPLVELNGRLTAVTPRALPEIPVLGFSQFVFATGSTIWVTNGTNRLACFTVGGGPGPVSSLDVAASPTALAAAGGEAFFAPAPDHSDRSGAEILGYRVPSSCR